MTSSSTLDMLGPLQHHMPSHPHITPSLHWSPTLNIESAYLEGTQWVELTAQS